MKRNIEWKEKTEDGARRTVRILFPGQGKVKWQFKRSDEEYWNYDLEPTPEDWETLEDKVDKLYPPRIKKKMLAGQALQRFDGNRT